MLKKNVLNITDLKYLSYKIFKMYLQLKNDNYNLIVNTYKILLIFFAIRKNFNIVSFIEIKQLQEINRRLYLAEEARQKVIKEKDAKARLLEIIYVYISFLYSILLHFLKWAKNYFKRFGNNFYAFLVFWLTKLLKLENIALISFLYLVLDLPLLKFFNLVESDDFDKDRQIAKALYEMTKVRHWINRPANYIKIDTISHYLSYLITLFYKKYFLKLKKKPSLYKALAAKLIKKDEEIKKSQIQYAKQKTREWAWRIVKRYFRKDRQGRTRIHGLMKLFGFSVEDILRNISPELYYIFLKLEITGRDMFKEMLPGKGYFNPLSVTFWDKFYPNIFQLEPIPDCVLENVNSEKLGTRIKIWFDNLTPDNCDTIIELLYNFFKNF